MAEGCSNDVVVVVSDCGRCGGGGESRLLASRFAVTAAAASSYVFCKRSTNVLDGSMEDELMGGGRGATQVCPSVWLRARVSVTSGFELGVPR